MCLLFYTGFGYPQAQQQAYGPGGYGGGGPDGYGGGGPGGYGGYGHQQGGNYHQADQGHGGNWKRQNDQGTEYLHVRTCYGLGY